MRWIYCADCGAARSFWRRTWPPWPPTLGEFLGGGEPCPNCGSARRAQGPGMVVGMGLILLVCFATGLAVVWVLLVRVFGPQL